MNRRTAAPIAAVAAAAALTLAGCAAGEGSSIAPDAAASSETWSSDELNIDFGRLQLEQATWAESNRIDQVARNRLGMVFPQADETVVVRP